MAETLLSSTKDQASEENLQSKANFVAHKQAMMNQVKSMLFSLNPKAL